MIIVVVASHVCIHEQFREKKSYILREFKNKNGIYHFWEGGRSWLLGERVIYVYRHINID